MGYKFITVPVRSTAKERGDKKTFTDLVKELKPKRQEEATQMAALSQGMEKPVAVFRSEYRNYWRSDLRFCGICEEAELSKMMAKVVTKSIYGKDMYVTVYSPDKDYAKAIKKRLKKKHKKAQVSFFGRSEGNLATVLVSC